MVRPDRPTPDAPTKDHRTKNPTVTPALLRHAVDLLAQALSGQQPADKHMENYFRKHPGLGVRDRGFVAETVYGCLRRRRSLQSLAREDSPSPATLVAVYLLAVQGWDERRLGALPVDAASLAAGVKTQDLSILPLAVQCDLPDWLAERLVAQLGAAEVQRLAQALNRPASVDLRVNTLKAERETVQARLAQEGYATELTPLAPSGLRRQERAPLFKTQCFQEGLFEIQDEGSQLLSFLVAPKRHEQVVDFCAGSGGKTLHLGALMANTGSLYAWDTAKHRLDKLKPRLRRAGLDNVRPQVIAHERDRRVQRLYGKIDRVLIDAPCSGTGTLRRNPDIKWRPQNIAELVAVQERILEAAAPLVKPGGRLVYATCSLLSEENEAVITRFLQSHPLFSITPASAILTQRRIPLSFSEPALRLYPHHHQTDGFYAVVLDRRD